LFVDAYEAGLQLHQQHVLLVEALGHLAQVAQGAREQARRHQQHQGQRHLRAQQDAARPLVAAAGDGVRRALQGQLQARPRRLPGGHQPQQQRRGRGQPPVKRHHPPVGVQGSASGSPAGTSDASASTIHPFDTRRRRATAAASSSLPRELLASRPPVAPSAARMLISVPGEPPGEQRGGRG
jgi:hypothetical protein